MTVFSTQGILTVEPPAQVTSAFPTQPRFTRVWGIARDSSGAYYVADTGAHQIFRVNSQGEAVAIAGSGSRGFTGDSTQATGASLNGPEGVVLDGEGNVIFADTANHRIRMVTPDGALRTIAGTGTAGFSGDSGSALSGSSTVPGGLAVRCGREHLRRRSKQPACPETRARPSAAAGDRRHQFHECRRRLQPAVRRRLVQPVRREPRGVRLSRRRSVARTSRRERRVRQ